MPMESNWDLKSFQIQASLFQFCTQMDAHVADVNTFAPVAFVLIILN